MKIGVLSDTHDLLRPEVIAALQGCETILHAGDISTPGVLAGLSQIAPVKAVRGNNEKGGTETLPPFLDFELAGFRVFMTHKKKDVPKDVSAYDLVICGHSHQYAEARAGHTLLLNPGSCGPRRFHQPITLAILTADGGGLSVRRIDIPHTPKEAAPKIDPGNVKAQIELVIRETQKGRGPVEIAQRSGLDPALTEQIAHLYVTHPGVTADGIMTKMGL